MFYQPNQITIQKPKLQLNSSSNSKNQFFSHIQWVESVEFINLFSEKKYLQQQSIDALLLHNGSIILIKN